MQAWRCAFPDRGGEPVLHGDLQGLSILEPEARPGLGRPNGWVG
jgi:hypothetical protein